MTRFLDVRLAAVGGELARSVAVFSGADIRGYSAYSVENLRADVDGKHVLIGTHGFNVNRQDGIRALANWEAQLQLPSPAEFVGLLWPGDSIWAHGLDYPEEPRVANEAARVIAPFIDANFGGAASISFASHSLGARVILGAISQMTLPIRRAIIMAAAIDNDCLDTEFCAASTRVGGISVLASRSDEVLAALFPLGNLLGGIIAAGHPWLHAALGHAGPSTPRPTTFVAPFQIPDSWDYGHGDYLRVATPVAPPVALPADVPPNGSNVPLNRAPGWTSSWSAAFASTRFR